MEGHHYGAAVVLATDGSELFSRGDVSSAILPRSCNKPLQAVGMVRAGLDVEGPHLALAAASHSGEPFHVEAVRRMLADGGLSEHDLQCPPDWPLLDSVKEAVIRAGGAPTRLQMNCSGKHAGMLRTARVRGWSLQDYLDPTHPVQVAIRAAVVDLTGEDVGVATTDGCGAPLLGTSLTGLARAFAGLATATEGPAARVAQAMRAHPEYVSGTTRDERVLMTAIPGAVAKAGAEACYAVGLRDGRAIALKIDDGSARARPVVMAALLDLLKVADVPGTDIAAVRRTGDIGVFGGGRRIGEVRAVLGRSLRC